MNLRQTFLDYIPEAYYSNGKLATCMTFRICDMFDANSDSFKEVKIKRKMEIKTRQKALEDYDLGTLWRLRKEEI